MRLSEARGADVLSTFPVKPSGQEKDVRRTGKRTGHLALAASADRRLGTAAESHGTYDEAMEKTSGAYIREFETSQDALESWYEHIETEYGPYLHGATEDAEKKREGKMALEQYSLLHDKLETIGNGWNTLDDRIVDNGRRKAALLAELRAFESEMPENVREAKQEAMERFDAAHAALVGDARMSDGAARKTPAREKSRAAGERKRRNERRPADEAFARAAQALRKNQIFRKKKGAEPLLIVRAVTPRGIDMEHRKNVSDAWDRYRVAPGEGKGFLEYLESTFGWTPENKKIAESKPEKKPVPERISRGAVPERVSSERSYEELHKGAEKEGYSYTLFGALAGGIRTMKEYAPGLAAQKEQHRQQIADALIRGMGDSFEMVGKKLGWSAEEKKIFIERIVADGIEKFL